MDTIATWTDSSGYYRVECDAACTVLHTFYSPTDTDPATVSLTPVPDYVPVEPWSPAGERFATDWATSRDYVRIDGIWYVTA